MIVDNATSLVPIALTMHLSNFRINDKFCMDADTDDKSLTHFIRKYCEDLRISKDDEKMIMEYIINLFKKNKEDIEKLKINKYGEKIETIELSLVVDEIKYEDKFLWNIYDPDSNPDDFSKSVCSDLDLPKSFCPEISFALRQKILQLRRQDKNIKKTNDVNLNESIKSEADNNEDECIFLLDGSNLYKSTYLRKRKEQEEWTPRVSFLMNERLLKENLEISSTLDNIQNISKNNEASAKEQLCNSESEKKPKIRKIHFKYSPSKAQFPQLKN